MIFFTDTLILLRWCLLCVYHRFVFFAGCLSHVRTPHLPPPLAPGFLQTKYSEVSERLRKIQKNSGFQYMSESS